MFIGEGDYQITLPPGTVTYDLERTASGHLMLPVDRFRELGEQVNEKRPKSDALGPSLTYQHFHVHDGESSSSQSPAPQ